MRLKLTKGSALTTVAEPVEPGTDVTELLVAMWALMFSHHGVGLAANQVGVLKRIIVVYANGLRLRLINPVITKCYGGKITGLEGCLSYPGVEVKMTRYKNIVVEGFDGDWKPVTLKLRGFIAYCVQHEIDHLNGKTIATEGLGKL